MKGYRFPRTITEAFGTDATSACSITCYRKSRAPVLVFAAIAAVCIIGLIEVLR